MIRPANPSSQWWIRGVGRYIKMENKTRNMEIMHAYNFRIYPDKKRQEAIDNAISMYQRLYNKLLEKTINAHK